MLRLTHRTERDGEIPRFLFRGFNKRSGGNSKLNTPTAITPHAFYGIPKHNRDDSWVDSALKIMFGPNREFFPPKPVRLGAMPYHQLSKEICDHLEGDRRLNSHFSSWTADFGIAMGIANRGPSPHLGILDTKKRHADNMIMHVLALWEAGLSRWKYPEEYLVYGTVQGDSYTCLTLAWQLYPTDLCFDLWVMLSPKTALAHIWRARDRTCRHSIYRHGDPWLQRLWGLRGDWALILTIIAAEWGRSKANVDPESYTPRVNDASLEEMNAVLLDLSPIIEQAARDPHLVLPLYNLHTYKDHLPCLDYMLRLLWRIEDRIQLLRSRPQPGPFSLTGYIWPPTSDQKKALESTGTSGSSNKTD